MMRDLAASDFHAGKSGCVVVTTEDDMTPYNKTVEVGTRMRTEILTLLPADCAS